MRIAVNRTKAYRQLSGLFNLYKTKVRTMKISCDNWTNEVWFESPPGSMIPLNLMPFHTSSNTERHHLRAVIHGSAPSVFVYVSASSQLRLSTVRAHTALQTCSPYDEFNARACFALCLSHTQRELAQQQKHFPAENLIIFIHHIMVETE